VRELPGRERALGLGAIAAASEGGALIGPLWGGTITDWLGWRAVFWLNLPLAAPLLLAAWRLASRERGVGRVDWAGAALLGGALALLTVALADDPLRPRPLTMTLGLLLVAGAAGAGFGWRERHAAEPLVRPAMLVRRTVLAAHLATLLAGGALIAVLIGVPLFVNLVLGEGPLAGGVTLLRLTVAVPVGALAGGWLASRIDLRPLAAAGMLLAAAGVAGLAAWDEGLGEPLRSAPQLAAGLGFGLVLAPLATAVLARVREGERATAAAWLTLARVAGMLVGTALLTSSGLGRFYARAASAELGAPEFEGVVRAAQVDTFREVFLAAAAALVVAAALCALIGRASDAAGPRGGEQKRWWLAA
jgi:MFS family permease